MEFFFKAFLLEASTVFTFLELLVEHFYEHHLIDIDFSC